MQYGATRASGFPLIGPPQPCNWFRMSFSGLDNNDLLDVGMNALRYGDLAEAEQTLRKFRGRRTKLAAENERQLRTALERARRRGYLSRPDHVVVRPRVAARAHVPARAHEIVTDQDIHPRIIRMIEGARHSVWLASLTPPSAEIAAVLGWAARRVPVVLIVAERCVKSWKQRERIEGLKAAGVDCRLLKSTHAKAAVIDELVYMIGSPNLHHVRRDLCVVAGDRVTALQMIAYLDSLP